MKLLISTFFTLVLLGFANNSSAADTYDIRTGILSIPFIAVEDVLYYDVAITIKSVISFSTDIHPDSYDTYELTSGILKIPNVIVGSDTYYDLHVLIAEVLSVGTSCEGVLFCYSKSTYIPSKDSTGLWKKYSLKKPVTPTEAAALATTYFRDYVKTIRNPSAKILTISQEGVDPILENWVSKSADLVAKAFQYPKKEGNHVNVIGIDRDWIIDTYSSQGYTNNDIKGRLAGWDAGNPAFGGMSTNTWNYTVIKDANLLVADKAGIAQTGAHEYFHTVQGNYVGLPESNFLWENVPSWVWEGSATFIGLQTSSFIGFVDYLTLGKAYQLDRYRFGTPENRTLLLSEVTKNTATSDPYGIGAAASEFLVSNIGMYNFIKIFKELKNKELPDAFFSATGIELEDFYQMFEEVRSTLGFPISL
jgi:hypothetical protein